jgi:hypothetical protein
MGRPAAGGVALGVAQREQRDDQDDQSEHSEGRTGRPLAIPPPGDLTG